jgi:beta-N-acetylhexosaminidase
MGSLRVLAEGCLLPGFAGTTAPGWVLRRLEGGLGGVVLYGRNVVDGPQRVAVLTARLAGARPDALVAIDEEGGDVTRLEAATGSSYPGNLALGVAGDVELTRAVAASMGAELAAAGIGLDLAPVADVNSNPENPVIGVRSFGADPDLVAAHTVAFVAGMQAAGVAACVKHFPGHGDTSVDSHLDLPVVGGGQEALEIALAPFRAAIAAGVRSVMTAHLVVPGLDTAPATLSRAILTGLLRERLGFEGLVITDGLEMAAIQLTVGLAEGAVRAIAAGADAICVGGGITDEGVVDLLAGALVDAVRGGRLTEERLAEAAGRVSDTGRWAIGARAAGPAPDRMLGLEAAWRALRATGVTPLTASPVVVELRPEASIAVGRVPWGVGDVLAGLDPAVTVLRLAGAPDEAALAAAGSRPLVLVVRDLHRHAGHAAAADAILAARPDTIVVEMGLPARRPVGAGAYVATHGAGHANAVAAAELLRGRNERKERTEA